MQAITAIINKNTKKPRIVLFFGINFCFITESNAKNNINAANKAIPTTVIDFSASFWASNKAIELNKLNIATYLDFAIAT